MKNKGLKPEDWTPGEKVVLYGFRDGKLSALPESGSGLHMRTARVIRAYQNFVHLEFFGAGGNRYAECWSYRNLYHARNKMRVTNEYRDALSPAGKTITDGRHFGYAGAKGLWR